MSLKTQDLKAGDILLYNSDNLVARLIRKFDNAEVSHAGLYLGNGQVGEALIVGNPGLNRNPIAASVKGSTWVEAARLRTDVDFDPMLAKADWYLDQGNRYAYEQVLMLAMILLTRKLDQNNWLVRQIAERTLSGCARLLHRWRDEGREPMICSEFVFRAFDEALPDDHDLFTIEIGEQGTGRPRRLMSRRRRRRLFGAAPTTESPTVHPESLLAKIADEPARMMGAATAVAPISAEDIEAEIDAPGREYLGDDVPLRTADKEASEISQDEVVAAAAEFASALIQGDGVFAAAPSAGEVGSAKAGSVDSVEQLKQIIADFVTPGDLHRSKSVSIAGRLDTEGMRR
jgi:hypothetical protein